MTGNVKVSPSSATSGGGAGTGSDRCSMAIAASSKEGSPDPFTTRVDSTCPTRSRMKLTTTSARCMIRSVGYRLYLLKCAASSFCHVTRSRRALSAVPSAGATERGASSALSRVRLAVSSVSTDSIEASACTAVIFGWSSSGFFVSLGATTRSGSSVSVGTALGRSVCSSTVFCSTTAGEAAAASVSGPTGKSVGSSRGAVNSTPISIAGAPRSVLLSGCIDVSASATPAAWIATAPSAAAIQTGRDKYRGRSRSDIAPMPPSLFAIRRRRRGGVVRHALERHEGDFGVPADAQALQHVHQLTVGHAAVGAQEDAAILALSRDGVQRAYQIDASDLSLADGDGEIGFDRHIGRLVRLLLRDRRRGRQVDRQIDGRERRRDHEDDEKNEHDVDEGRDVDVVRLVEIVVVLDVADCSRHRSLRRVRGQPAAAVVEVA